ncbi:MAG: peptide ABC transporter substrate-binding protein [Lacunisphaera sp.]|nr:peptide ABC transporter substrate-binding protein [Lacunisphaera sp.]
MRFTVRLCLCVALLGLALAGCSRRETAVAQGNRTGVFHCSIGSEPTDLDPHIVTGIGEAKVIHSLFEPLVSFDPQTLKPAPALAERWDVSPDGLVYTFHLRANAKWSNGEPLTAQDCVESWRRMLTPTLAADYAYLFYLIKGAENFNKGRTADFATVGLAAPDAHTFVVTLLQPAPYFLQILLNSPWRPVNVRSIAAVGDAYRRGTPWTRVGRIVTSGPFMLKEWSPQEHLIVEKSPTYWDKDHVHLNAIVFYPIDNIDAEERAFRAGQLHVTYNLSISKIPTYRREQPASLRIDDYINTFFFRFNTRHAPLDDARVRRALSLAIDRQLIADKVLQGGQRPASSLVPPEMPDYTPPAPPLHDLDTARRLLAAAGYPGGKGLPALELLYNNSAILRLVAEAIQEMWRRDLGIEVRLANQEYKVVFANRRTGNYQILLGDWVGDYLDPTTYLDLWRSDAGNNHTGWGSKEYDDLMNRAAATVDVPARADLLRQAEQLMLEAAPIAPIYFNPHVYLKQSSLKHWRPSPMDHIDYRHVSLEP